MVNNPNRLTLNNPVSEMGMSELWMNNCFAKDGWAMYRDFDGESDLLQFIKRVAEDMGVEIAIDYDNDYFCDMLFDWLEDGLDSKTGLLAFLYHMMVSKAELYEKLKRYEDAEEAGLLLKSPIPIGTEVYSIQHGTKWVDVEINGEKYKKQVPNNYIDKHQYNWLDATIHNEHPDQERQYFLSIDEAKAELERRNNEKADHRL